MFEKDTVLFGLIFGLCIPFVGYATILMLLEQLAKMESLGSEIQTIHFRQRTIAILAICLNLIPFNIYKNKRFESSMRGVVIATFIYVFIWCIYFVYLML